MGAGAAAGAGDAGSGAADDTGDTGVAFALGSSSNGGIEASRSAATGALGGTSIQCAQAKNTMFAATNARKLKRTRGF
jgi:hypothetical protein